MNAASVIAALASDILTFVSTRQVANVSRRFPQLLVALAESHVSLTVAALLVPHLTEENVEKLLSDCAGQLG